MKVEKQVRLLGMKFRRIEMGMTQGELADIVGVHHHSIHCYEKGSRVPKRYIAEKIAAALKCSVEELKGR